MEEEKFYLQIDLGKNGDLKFLDLSEIEEFSRRELDYWNWLNDPPVRGRMGDRAFRHINSNIKNVLNIVEHLKSLPDYPVSELVAALSQAFDNARIPLSTSPVGAFLEELKSENPVTAAAALTAWMNLEGIRFHIFEEIKGPMLIAAFDANISNKTPAAVRTSLKKLNQSFQASLDQARAQLEDQGQDFGDATISQRNIIAKLLRGVRSKTFKFRAKQLREIDRALKQIYQTEALYKEHMRLQGPVEYWNEKAESHKGTAKTYRTVLSWFGVIASLVLVGGLYWLAEHAIQIASTDKPPTIYLVLVTLGVVATTILFWIARILTRLFLSEHHLAIDARERAVMAQTYLALTAEGQATEQERALVLASLFRPTADGIVKDDAAPDLSPAVLLSKFDPK